MNAEEQEYMDYLIHNRTQLTNQITRHLDRIDLLEMRLEVSEKEHYKTLQQLAIATKALREYADPQIWGMDGFCYKDRSMAEQALKEIDLVGASTKEEV